MMCLYTKESLVLMSPCILQAESLWLSQISLSLVLLTEKTIHFIYYFFPFVSFQSIKEMKEKVFDACKMNNKKI